MFRYLAVVWDRAIPAQTEDAAAVCRRVETASDAMACASSGPGLRVFVTGTRAGSSEVYALSQATGIVLGRLFTRSNAQTSPAVCAALLARESELIIASGGQHLVDHYWGRYIAFLNDAAKRTVIVARDPTGAIPCFYTTRPGVRIYFSNAADLLQLRSYSTSVNFRFVRALMVNHALQVRETGLDGISELQPGEAVSVARGATQSRTLWDPLSIARAHIIEDVQTAVAAVRSTVRSCVRSWVGSYPNSILHLSGGLDSSVVLCALMDTRAAEAVTCLNYYDDSTEGDEREYARTAAAGANCRLLEVRRQVTELQLDALLAMPATVHPEGYIYRSGQGQLDVEAARQSGATAIFEGCGGDQLFFRDRRALAMTDYVYQHGAGRKLWQVAMDVARLEGYTVWRVLKEGLRGGLLRPAYDPLKDAGLYPRFASADLLAEVEAGSCSIPAVMRSGLRIPPGKLYQIESMSKPYLAHDPLAPADGPDFVNPLASQPLMELCLRIPTYLHTAGGQDRSIARRAFATELPGRIFTRRSKGGMTHFSVRVLRANREFFRELLLGGSLAEERLLNVRELEGFLSSDFDAFSNGVTEILYCLLRFEIWLRTWTSGRNAAIAA